MADFLAVNYSKTSLSWTLAVALKCIQLTEVSKIEVKGKIILSDCGVMAVQSIYLHKLTTVGLLELRINDIIIIIF